MLLFAITKHCCRSGNISLVEEQQQQDVATGVSCQLPFLLKAVKSVLNYSKTAVRNDGTSICTTRTLIKTTKPTSVPVQRPNSDLFYMPYYELSTLITTPTMKFPLIWSVVGTCSRNIKSLAGVPNLLNHLIEKTLQRAVFPS